MNAPTNVVFSAFASSAVGSTVTLRWTTTEVDVIGFRLYRSASENDGYQAIRTALVPAQLEPGGASYTYFDLNVPDGRWYYRIEAITGMGGVAATAGPASVLVEAATGYRLFLPLITSDAEDLG